MPPTKARLAPPPDASLPAEDLEAWRALHDLAHRKTGTIPERVLCAHVLRVTRGGDFSVQRAAMEAILRRIDGARRDGLRIAARPPRGQVLGSYRTQRKGRDARPYETQLLSIDPPAGRCGCPDYGKGSLGLCKHLLVVLGEVSRRPRLVAAAARAGAAAPAPGARLSFDPLCPLEGPADWMMRVCLEGAALRPGTRTERLLRWFERGAGAAPRLLRAVHGDDPARRLELCDDLLAACKAERDGDPALPPLLHEERERLRRILALAPLRRDLPRLLRTLKVPLYPYQVEGVDRFLGTSRLLLADDMGLGKTAQAIAACHVLWQAGCVKRGLLLVPAALKPQWLREWHHFTDAPITLIEGTREERGRRYAAATRGGPGFLLCNYEQMLRDLPLLHALSPDMVVLDEAQRIKNWATKTAAFVKTLGADYRLVLTGTPMENRLEELASLMDWVDPRALEPKWRLQPFHSHASDGGGGGARNLGRLRERLAPSMLRRVRADVLAQLPPRTDTRVPVEMTAQQRAAHDELNQPIAQLIAISHRRPLLPAEHLKLMALLTQQRVISNGLAQLRFTEVWPALAQAHAPTPALREALLSPKLEVLRDLVAELVLRQGRKVVIFSQWRRMLRLGEWVVRDLLAEEGLRAVFFTGGEDGRRRTQNIVDFHDDDRTRIMFLSDAGGVGLNLQRAASACVNLEMPWNPAVLEQRIGRIYRLGQKQPIDVYNLVTEEGIESRIAELVGNKRALFAGLFDGTSDEVRFEQAGSLLSRIEQYYPVAEAAAEAAEGEIVGDGDDDVDLAAWDGEGADAEEARALPAASTEPAVQTRHGIEAEARAGAGGVAEHLLRGAALPSGDEQARVAEGPAADGPRPQPPAEEASPPEAPSASSGDETQGGALPAAAVQRLFAQVRFERTERGGLRIEASPEAAGTLAALFQGMADLLQQAGAAPPR